MLEHGKEERKRRIDIREGLTFVRRRREEQKQKKEPISALGTGARRANQRA